MRPISGLEFHLQFLYELLIAGENSMSFPFLMEWEWTIEAMPDPKATMFAQLRVASGLNARRLRAFNEGRARARVAELIDDFSPLRALRAFVEFESAVQAAIERVV